jgi:quinol monooxygenase YgiN
MLAIVATLRVKAGSEADFEAVAKELVAKVNANEPGCELYQLHRSDDPQTYYFLERYRDMAAIEFHRSTPHFKELGAKMGAFMEGRPQIVRLTQV